MTRKLKIAYTFKMKVWITFIFTLLKLHYQTETSLSAKGRLKNKKQSAASF